MSATRVRAIFRKELREYRRNRRIVVSMTVLPLLFSLYPSLQIFALPVSSVSSLAGKEPLVYMLAIPAIVPATVAAYSVAGERQQGTLEPVLTTPIRADEFLLGKALAALVPVLAVSYAVFGLFVAAVEIFAKPPVASAVLSGPGLLAQLIFTPLVAALSNWVGIAISSRSSEVRVAVQLNALSSAPTIAVTTIIAVGAVHVSFGFVLGLGIALLLIDSLGWRIVSPLFDRERLIMATSSLGPRRPAW